MYSPDSPRKEADARLADPGRVKRACERIFGLTGREAEIAYWMAQGKTNLEIAVILAIATRTVEKHVEHVLAKLGVENRVAAAVQIHSRSRAPA